jgi:hypothetical protein
MTTTQTARRVTTGDITPGRTDRAVFVGQTGSGKTTLAEKLCETRRFVVALDPKGLLKWGGYRRYTTLDRVIQVKALEAPRIIYAPSYEELTDEETMDTFFRWVYERGNCTVYVDELYAITRGDSYPWNLGACYTRGRERNVEIWGATQRPARVPQIVFSESEHVYCFRLRMPQDRERVEQMTGISEDRIAALQKRHFIYAPQDGDISPVMSLNLSGKKK